MKNLKFLKGLLIIMLSIVIAVACSKIVFAADELDDEEDFFSSLDKTNFSNTGNTGNTNDAGNINTNGSTGNTGNITPTLNTTNNTNSTNNTTNNTTINITNNTTNRNVSNTLAKTGIEDFKGGAVILVVCIISAIYSFKKINDYKKI